MNVDRNAVQLAVIGAGVKQRAREYKVTPAFFFRQFGQVKKQAFLDQVFGLTTMVELCGAHRVAAQQAGYNGRDGVGSATASNRAINPLVAGSVERLGEFIHSCGFTAGGPPVDNFQLGRLGCTACEHRGCYELQEFSSLVFPL